MYLALKYREGAKPGIKRPATSLQKESKKEKIEKQRVYEETRRNRPYLTRWEAESPWLVYEGPGKATNKDKLKLLKSVRRWRIVQNESQLFGIQFKNTAGNLSKMIFTCSMFHLAFKLSIKFMFSNILPL